MKRADLIELAEDPIDEILPYDHETEMQDWFGIYSKVDVGS